MSNKEKAIEEMLAGILTKLPEMGDETKGELFPLNSGLIIERVVALLGEPCGTCGGSGDCLAKCMECGASMPNVDSTCSCCGITGNGITNPYPCPVCSVSHKDDCRTCPDNMKNGRGYKASE